jgi:hypothetical protein
MLPFTPIEADVVDAEYPDTLLIVSMYVPFARENKDDVHVIAPESIPLMRLTYHVVPDGRPDSRNDSMTI